MQLFGGYNKPYYNRGDLDNTKNKHQNINMYTTEYSHVVQTSCDLEISIL